MKIVIISPAHPLRGGIAASTERLAQEMQTAGHEVVIHSFSMQYPAFLFPGKTQFSDDPAPENLKIRTFINSANPFNWVSCAWKLAAEKPDTVVVRFWMPFFGPCLGSILWLARLFSKKKFRATALVDNIVPHEKRPGDWLFAKYFTSACGDFVVMSRSVGDEIRHFSKTKPLRFAPHPIYDNYGEAVSKTEARRSLGISGEEKLVLFFGLIRDYKGLDLLLESLTDEKLKAKNVAAVVAGEPYGSFEKYAQTIDNQRLAERIHLFLEFVPTEKVRQFFCAADLVVQPYKTATQSGISQIAYHFDKPMVVTNVGGLPEIVTDGVSGYVVEPEPKAIAHAIFDFFENRREAEMTAGVRAEKARFSWQNLMNAVLKS